jgi:ferredoxin
MTHGLKVEVDREICIGAEDCVRRAPSGFAMDEAEGVAVVTDPASVDEETLRAAALFCPSGAITVVE